MTDAASPFAEMLTGGHPNSLGRTVEVVEAALAEPDRLDALFACYQSDDPVVRLRASNALKRIEKAAPDLMIPYIDRLLTEVAAVDQPSARWTVAQLFGRMAKAMTPAQRREAEALLKRNLEEEPDWIVQNTTMDTLAGWAKSDEALRTWLLLRLAERQTDERKSVAARARKHHAALTAKA